MSATMDVDHFSHYFNKASVVYLEGRQFPIQVFHAKQTQEDYLFSSLVTLFQIHKDAPAE
jgi:ATP-dependent RNA helicase DHX33